MHDILIPDRRRGSSNYRQKDRQMPHAPRPIATPANDDPLMTTEETSAYVKATVVHLAQLRHRGQGPSFIKFSTKKVLYRKSSVDAWLADRERTITS
jgi:hypothetical protein